MGCAAVRWDMLDTRAVAYADDEPLRAHPQGLALRGSQVDLARAFQVGLSRLHSYDIRQRDAQLIA